MFIYFLIGIFAGFMSGMFGIGGGSVRIPLLTVAGLPLLTAYGINLFVIPFSSLVGAISHRKNIEFKLSIYMVIGGIAGSITGAYLVGFIPTLILAIIFLIITILTVSGIYLHRIAPSFTKKLKATSNKVLFGAFLINLITGMRGGSGGSLFPAFLRALNIDIHKSIATSLFVTIFTALSACFIYWHRGDIRWLPAVSVLAGSMIGAFLGSKVALKSKPVWLESGLSVLVVALALLIVYKSIIHH